MSTSSEEEPPVSDRFLTDESLVFEQNAWDHVLPPDDQDERVQVALERQRATPVPQDQKAKYNARPSLYWDIFYRNNQSNFFKDRKWLQREFPQLQAVAEADAGPKTVLEVGCGAGNVLFPLLSSNKNPQLRIHAYDYSKHAIRVVQATPSYTSPPCGTAYASIWDLSSRTLPEGLNPCSVDVAVMIFVLSALHPNEWAQAVANIYTVLKPGGIIVMRDYGRHDLAQLRFKEGRMLADNFYIRGDGTRVYFFEPGELARLFTGSDLEVKEDGPRVRQLKILHRDPTSDAPIPTPHSQSAFPTSEEKNTHSPVLPEVEEVEVEDDEGAGEDSSQANSTFIRYKKGTPLPVPPPALFTSPPSDSLPTHPLFTIVQLGVDRRMLVNRKKQLKMYRVWLQAEFRKNESPDDWKWEPTLCTDTYPAGSPVALLASESQAHAE